MVNLGNSVIKKSSNHINQNEGTIFERSRQGKIGYHLPALDVEAALSNYAAISRRPRPARLGYDDADRFNTSEYRFRIGSGSREQIYRRQPPRTDRDRDLRQFTLQRRTIERTQERARRRLARNGFGSLRNRAAGAR